MKIRINILVVFLILLISFAGSAANSAELQNNHFHSYLRKGIDKAFNLETAAAGEFIMKAV
jgi:hypothetical protein